jgi:hypothetical protein
MESNVISRNGGVIRDPDEEGSALIVWGWCSAAQARLLLVQVEGRVGIPVGHLGSWVVGCRNGHPWVIEAHNSDGTLVGLLDQHVW